LTVTIDGTQVATINQYSASTLLQQQWTSGTLSGGSHTLTLTHGGSGTYVDLDAIIVIESTPATTVYDDTSGAISYSGGWSASTLDGAYDGTDHYTSS